MLEMWINKFLEVKVNYEIKLKSEECMFIVEEKMYKMLGRWH